MSARVFIDGHAGTTGLQIHQRLAGRSDIELVEIEAAERKSPTARRAALRSADVAILCLPDDAAREAVELIGDAPTRVLDASTAHRTAEGWVFGLPELDPEHRARVATATRVANTGCYPVTFILGLRPLLAGGLVRADAAVSVHALSGYTGGGKALTERWEDRERGLLEMVYEAPYALDRRHKHIPEMVRYSGLGHDPHFLPSVGPFACGMRVQVSIAASGLARGVGAEAIHEALAARYADEPFVRVHPLGVPADADESTFDPRGCNGTNRIELRVIGNPSGHVLLMGILDNLGKGASGNAVQCLNLMLGLAETAGLEA
ncbi:MAG: N-acetyl-gamma-glutamyl-phosphate reductase [Ectothiorhodospiraceae bacterium]|nr:N-acetyl-gamma-glutamyl-phosphate reductase [Ectothiorhodospiraceae bacterium]